MIQSYRMIAIMAHGDQRYGDFPYAVHLAHVESILEEFGYSTDVWKAAAWLHDVFEDTQYPREQVRNTFGDRVHNIAWACSGFGDNRAARNLCIKEKILALPEAAIVKCADRIANVEFSANTRKSGMVDKYKKEMESFETYIRANVPEFMWRRLEHSVFNKDS